MSRSNKSSDGLWLFLFGLGANLFTQVIGYITFSELALLFAGPYFIFRYWNVSGGTRGRVLFLLSALWLLSAVIADLSTGTPLAAAIRGWARPVFIGAAIVVFYQLMRKDPKQAQWFFLGYAFSCAISIYIFKPGSIDVTERIHDITIVGSFEKQIIPIVVAGVQFILFYFGGSSPILSGLSAVGLGAMSIFFGSRSGGAVAALAGLISLAAHFVLPIRNGQYRMSRPKIMAFIGLMVIGGISVLFAYSEAASTGLLGTQAYEKYNAQRRSKFGLLLGGRTEAIGGVLAVRDNPILGHGSWPIDYNGYTEDAAELAGVVLDKETEVALRHGWVRIPAHSHLLEAWVEHGFLATLLWWYIIFLMARLAVKGIFRFPDLFPATALLLLQQGWDIAFSPIGGRVALAASLAYFAALADAADRADRAPRLPRQQSMRPRRQRPSIPTTKPV